MPAPEANVLTARIREMEREMQRGPRETHPLSHARPVPTQPRVSLQNPGNWKPAKPFSCPVVLEPQEVLGRKELQVLKVRCWRAGRDLG